MNFIDSTQSRTVIFTGKRALLAILKIYLIYKHLKHYLPVKISGIGH